MGPVMRDLGGLLDAVREGLNQFRGSRSSARAA